MLGRTDVSLTWNLVELVDPVSHACRLLPVCSVAQKSSFVETQRNPTLQPTMNSGALSAEIIQPWAV